MRHQTISLLLALGLSGGLARAQSFDPPVALDIHPNSTIVEVNLTARVNPTWQYVSGFDTEVWGYEDTSPGGAGFSIPGPTIRANVGDTVIVHFTNKLPEATTIHWHGLEVPADMDGSHISQLHVPGTDTAGPAGGTFTYQFKMLTEGLYWYHPHVRTFDQVEKGLHGAILVKDPAKDAIAFANVGGRAVEEHIVVFDDVLLDDQDYSLVPAFSFTDPMQNVLYQLNGRVGNHLLVNGKKAENVTLDVTNGAVQVWHVLNAANTSFCRLKVSNKVVGGNGMPVDLWEIGSDGGYVEYPFKRFAVTYVGPAASNEDHPGQILISETYAGILLFPGERMTVAFTPSGQNLDTFRIEQWDWFRGRHIAMQPGGPGTAIMLPDDPLDGFYPEQDYFQVRLNGTDPGLGEWVPNFFFLFPDLQVASGTIPMTFGHGDPDPNTGNVVLFAQSKGVPNTPSFVPLPTAKIDSFEAHDVNVGDVKLWEVTNLTHGDHNFHTHGFFFELLDYSWHDPLLTPNPVIQNVIGAVGPNAPPRKRKDVVRIPARTGAKGMSKSVTRLHMTFDDTGREGEIVAHGERATVRPNGDWVSGGWLAHCHILEHSARGMLSFYEVHDPSDPFTLLGKHLAGTNGYPFLTGDAPMGGSGNPLKLHLVNALPAANTFMILGVTEGRLPIFGGEVVPGAPAVVLAGTTNAQGKYTWDIPGWEPVPAGIPVWFQVIFNDLGAANYRALSNAVKWVRP